MEIVEDKDGDIVVLSLSGRLDGATAEGAQQKIFALIDQGEKQFVLDASKLAYISSSGLRVLLLAGKRLAKVSGRLTICALSERIRKVFDMTGLTTVFEICDSREDAIAKLRGGE